jgi:hypothetical protein
MFKVLFKPLFLWLFVRIAEALDRRFGWHSLSVPAGLATLIGIRERLRQRNLYDTSPTTDRAQQPAPADGRYLTTRTANGMFNDLESPAMGSAGTGFGRNVTPERGYPQNEWAILNDPNPREVSRRLLTRNAFEPARTLNLLAAAWLQFMIRDWFSHGEGDMGRTWELKLPENDNWPEGAEHNTDPMLIPRTPPELPRSQDDTSPPTFANTETHWWDGSQIYGSNESVQESMRLLRDGKLKISIDRPVSPVRADARKHPAEEPGFWIGMGMMAILFIMEHNAICDRLRAEYPTWSDDELFERARLINAALMAKIHTVEWTPAIIDHPTTRVAMNANWWGLATERIHRVFGRISEWEVISGIPGSQKKHFGAPYALTEEFVAVYRMHPLIPDHFNFHSATTHEPLNERPLTLPEVAGGEAIELMQQVPMQDLFYSFGIAHPGAITLHNFPRFLQSFERPDGNFMDLGATDILRTRELGVPRYNEFRKMLRLPPVKSFEELTDNPVWVKELRSVYKNDINRVDLIIGLFAEPRPQGFGFSDTAFRIFILMASRRLNSDRFFTTDYTPEVYTQVGLDWIANNTMKTVLLRHLPGLLPTLRGVENAFTPWPKVRS